MALVLTIRAINSGSYMLFGTEDKALLLSPLTNENLGVVSREGLLCICWLDGVKGLLLTVPLYSPCPTPSDEHFVLFSDPTSHNILSPRIAALIGKIKGVGRKHPRFPTCSAFSSVIMGEPSILTKASLSTWCPRPHPRCLFKDIALIFLLSAFYFFCSFFFQLIC